MSELELQTKVCSTCCTRKLFSDFSKRKETKDGLHYVCKKCANESRNKRRRENPLVLKDEKLRETFGITFEDYKQILLKQDGVCAICGHPETSTYKGKLRYLSVDHDHKTGQVRGLLCNDCNVGLGWFKDDIRVLKDAIRYLVFWKNI